MRTSLRELLGHVGQLQQLDQLRSPDPQLAAAARQTIGAAAAGLRQLLQQWRPDWSPEQQPRQLTEALHQACSTVHAGNHAGQLTRPAMLLATAGDAVGAVCGEATPASDRWVISLAIADVVRTSSSTYTKHGPALADPHVRAARAAAVAVTHAGRRLVPGADPRLLELPIPAPPSVAPDPISRAAAAAADIEHALTMAAIDHTRPAVTVYELRALAAAFQAAAQFAGAELHAGPVEAVRAWGRVRQLARRLCDGARPTPDGPERLLRCAAELHRHLQHATRDNRAEPRYALALHEIMTCVTGSATQLCAHAYRMAGRVYARADQLPTNESRAAQRLRHQPIIVNADDMRVLTQALAAAEAASTGLIQPSPIPHLGLGDYPTLPPPPAELAPPAHSIAPPSI